MGSWGPRARAAPRQTPDVVPVETTATVHGPQGAGVEPGLLANLQREAGNLAVAAMLGGAHRGTAVAERAARELGVAPPGQLGEPDRSLQAPQPRGPHQASAAPAALPVRGPVVQRVIAGSFPTPLGGFELDLHPAVNAAGAPFEDVDIKFLPSKDAPYTNKLGLVQIVKLTDAKGTNLNPASMPASSAPSLRTAEDKGKGVEKGFFTDVLHQNFNAAGPLPAQPKGSAATPYYQGGTPVFGFKRSSEDQDIKAAEIRDAPGGTTADIDFSFETVAKGDDNLITYGAVKWSFQIRKGAIVNEQSAVSDVASATFDAALEAHRDFYVHEPMTFYFDFDDDQPSSGETDKIDTFLDYLKKFPDVQLNLAAFADSRGSADYNKKLALRRANSLAQALLAKNVAAARIQPLGLEAESGSTQQFTQDAKDNTPEGQDREANRRGNRRVTLTFIHVPGSAAAGGGASPAGGAAAGGGGGGTP